MHTAVMMTAVAVLGFLFRLFDGRGILVPLGFGLAFGRTGIRVFGFRGLAFLPAFVLGRRIGDALVEDACQDALEVLKVSSDSSSWPSEKMPLMMVSMCVLIRAGVGSVSVRLEASTESASMRMAASLVWGRGPG